MGKSLESHFEKYGEVIGAALAYVDRRMPAELYLRGLMLPEGSPRTCLVIDEMHSPMTVIGLAQALQARHRASLV